MTDADNVSARGFGAKRADIDRRIRYSKVVARTQKERMITQPVMLIAIKNAA
jgi:hypothetical protein